jgi:hypothetical protein
MTYLNQAPENWSPDWDPVLPRENWSSDSGKNNGVICARVVEVAKGKPLNPKFVIEMTTKTDPA